FFQRFSLSVRTARALADCHVKELALNFSYGSTQQALRLTAAAPETKFDTWADASPSRSWAIDPEVTLGDEAPFDAGKILGLGPVTGDSRELMLDLDRMLATTWIDVVSVPDVRVQLTDVTVTQTRDGAAVADQLVSLSHNQPTGRAWFRDVRPTDRFTASLV